MRPVRVQLKCVLRPNRLCGTVLKNFKSAPFFELAQHPFISTIQAFEYGFKWSEPTAEACLKA